MNKLFSRLAPALLLCLPLLVPAQAGRVDPADPAAPAPALRHQSAFADYKPWLDITPSDWRAVNDTVRGVGTKAAGNASPATQGVPTNSASAPAAGASRPPIQTQAPNTLHGGRP